MRCLGIGPDMEFTVGDATPELSGEGVAGLFERWSGEAQADYRMLTI